MQKTLQVIVKKWTDTNKKIKSIIKVGFYIFLVVLLAGTVLAAIDLYIPGYQENLVLITKPLITTSFYLLAEFVVGALVLDYVFKS